MRAAVVERYGPPDVVSIRDVETPSPGPNEVLIRVAATCVNSGDARLRALRVPRGVSPLVRMQMGWSGPKQPILGFEAAGEVAAVGNAVTRFRPGDRVVASRGFASMGHAEYLTVAEDGAIAKIPENVSFTDAAAVIFGGQTSLHFFELGGLKAGESILINGASGAVGVMAVQLARHMGLHVTAVCSGANAGLVRSLGADRVIDYAREDFAAGGERYDVIMENVGNARFSRIAHLLKPGGRFLQVIGDLFDMLAATMNKQVVVAKGQDQVNARAYAMLMDLLASGAIRPVIDSTFAFEDMAEAHRRVDSGRKVGSVVVTLAA